MLIFLLCFLGLFLYFGVHIQNLSAFVFATDRTSNVRGLGAATFFAESFRRNYKSMMTPSIAPLALRMSHSDYHKR